MVPGLTSPNCMSSGAGWVSITTSSDNSSFQKALLTSKVLERGQDWLVLQGTGVHLRL